MKRSLLFLLIIISVVNMHAATVTIAAGELSTALTNEDKDTITSLTITGTIDARDFKTMRDSMPLLKNVDLSNTSIVTYTGTYGTGTGSLSYLADSVPVKAFNSKTTLISVSLPSSVTAICDSAFMQCTKLGSMPLPVSLISIGKRSFYNCMVLSEVNFPSSLASIEMYAFYNNDEITSVIVPASVKSFGTHIFDECDGLLTAKFLASVTTLPISTFFSCTELTSVDLGSSTVETIAQNAFMYCEKLNSVSLPSTFKTIGSWAFSHCYALQSIYLPLSVTYLDLNCFENSGLKSVLLPPNITGINYKAFIQSAVDTIVIPHLIDELNYETFNGCTNLKSVTIPSSVASIEEKCFNNCTSLASIYIYRPSPINLDPDDNIFAGVDTTNCILYVPEGSASKYRTADVWKSFSNIVEITTNKKLNIKAGSLSSALTASQKSNIKDLTLTGTMDARDFRIIRDSLPLLENLDICNATIIEYTGLYGTGGNNSITYNAKTIPVNAFSGKTSLLTVKLPILASYVDDYAFRNCSWLKSVAFNNTNLLDFGKGIFKSCSNLTSADMPEQVKYISDSMFFGCQNITSLIVPDSVTYIGHSAFSGCSGLTKISIPEIVDSVYSCAFYNCSELERIYADHAVPLNLNSHDSVFYNVNTNSCLLSVPSGSNGIYSVAEVWKDFINIIEVESELTINPGTAGTLNDVLSDNQKEYTQSLILTGEIDARDFKTIRDSMPSLQKVDLKSADIVYYSGAYGTAGNRVYQADEIPQSALSNNEKIQSFIIPESATNIDERGLRFAGALKNIEIPESITSLENSSFFSCGSLSSVSLPATLTSIEGYAFSSCYSLKSIYSYSNTPPSMGSSVFYDVDTVNCVLYVPEYAINLYKAANQWKDFVHIEPVPYLLSVMQDTLYIDEKNNPVNLEVESNTTWHTSSESWISLNNGTFTGTAKLEITANENPEITTRTGLLTLWAEGADTIAVTVIQPGSDATLSASVSELNIQASTASETVTVLSNTTWAASSDKSWLSLNPSTGTGDGTLTLLAEENTTGAVRTATVTISATGVDDVVITVIQSITTGLLLIPDNIDVNIYPNPVSTYFIITGIGNEINMKLFDINGRMVLSGIVSNNEKITVNRLPDGIYFLKLLVNKTIISKKIIRE